MAGRNNKASRGSGGAVSSAPPKPSGMKVNLFQQASRDARSQNTRAFARTSRQEDASARTVNKRLTGGAGSGVRRAEKSLQTAQKANAYRIGLGSRLNEGKKGYRAPATRLY